jgi:tRNA(Arg) A34 adenosine deaminase TadA
MEEAILVAKESRQLGDYAFGAVVVYKGKIIARAGNRIRTEMDPTSHHEIVAMRMACRELGSRYLTGCTLYTTAAPCPMCITAAVWAKLSGVVYGVSQHDIIRYGVKYGNEKYKWRGATIEPEVMYHSFLGHAWPGMHISQHMQAECKKLFHNKP